MTDFDRSPPKYQRIREIDVKEVVMSDKLFTQAPKGIYHGILHEVRTELLKGKRGGEYARLTVVLKISEGPHKGRLLPIFAELSKENDGKFALSANFWLGHRFMESSGRTLKDKVKAYFGCGMWWLMVRERGKRPACVAGVSPSASSPDDWQKELDS
jgi:hypothetical protein